MFDLSKHLSRSASKPCVQRRRKLADQSTRESLDHPAVGTARHPFIPGKVRRAHTVELIWLELHVELVDVMVNVDGLHHLLSPAQQMLTGDELLQPTVGDVRVGRWLRARLTYGGHCNVQRRLR